MEIFQDMEGLVQKRVEIQDMEFFQDSEIILNMEIILDMEAKHYRPLYRTTTGRRKQIYRQAYNLYAYALH